MKVFEQFRIAGYGDVGKAENAHKKLLSHLSDLTKATKQKNYSFVLARFDKLSVEFAFAKALEEAQKQEESSKNTDDNGKWN